MDPSSIQRASDLVNSVLFARGYFSNDERLAFSTIDTDNTLSTPEAVHDNDKLVLNTMYALIQELDQVKSERQYLTDQLEDKAEIIKHYEASNSELNARVETMKRESILRANEISVLKEGARGMKGRLADKDRQLQSERNVSNALKTRYDVEMKKKALQIEKLQDRLLSKRGKFQSIIQRNNPVLSGRDGDGDSKKLALDDEMESMLVNLSELITKLTSENNEGVGLLQFIHAYLGVLADSGMRRLQGGNVGLPPTPQFFYDQIASVTKDDSDVTEKLSHVVEMDKIKPGVMDSLGVLYQLLTNDLGTTVQRDDGKVEQLQKEIAILRKNLDMAMETNDKWRKRFEQK